MAEYQLCGLIFWQIPIFTSSDSINSDQDTYVFKHTYIDADIWIYVYIQKMQI
jgi:hypothetical protein